jgi:hypothetical protein
MKVSSLVVKAAARAFRDRPDLLGVRISPLTLSATEASALADAAARELDKAYVVVSAPGIELLDRDRLFVAPDERAAERATTWRNRVNVSVGEHLLYVSAEEHNKAGGLQDCLVELSDADLANELLDSCEKPLSGLSHVLRESNLVGRVGLPELSTFVQMASRAVQTDKKPWPAIGECLPVIGLIKDTALTAANAAQRLSTNLDIVSRAGAGARRGSSGPRGEMERHIREGLRDGQSILQDLDLADARFVPKTTAPKGQQAKSIPKRKIKAKVVAPGVDQPPPEPLQVRGTEAPESGPSPPAKRRARGWPTVNALPSGLTRLLAELISAGAPLHIRVRGPARSLLSTLPGGVNIVPVPHDWPTDFRPVLGELQSCRERLLRTIDEDSERTATLLVRAPNALLGNGEVRAAATEYVSAAVAVYVATREAGDELAMRAALELDTVAISDERGDALRLLGPLHPLYLAQALAFATASGERDPLVTRLLERVTAEPAAPAVWPSEKGLELRLATPVHGLVVYDREPGAVTAASLHPLGYRLLRRFLGLHPHARFGVKVVVIGPDPSLFVEGMAEAARDAGDDARVRVMCEHAVSLEFNRPAAELAASGRLSVEAIPREWRAICELRPHMVVRLAPPDPGPGDDEPGSSADAAPAHGLLQTEFALNDRGLKARTVLDGVPALQEVEALNCALRGRRPQGAFAHELRVSSLASVIPTEGASPMTWHVAVGPRLGRRPPPDHRLLIHELVEGGATCAVITRDIKPAARAVLDGLVSCGLLEGIPSRGIVTSLTSRLAAASGGGLLSLEHSVGEHLIAAGLLSLELQKRADRSEVIIARAEGTNYRVLTDEPGESDPLGALAISVSPTGDGLALTIGYATLAKDVDLHLQRGRLAGKPIDRLRRVLQIVRLANERTGVASSAAREVLAWLLWGAAAADAHRREVIAALSAWGRGAPATRSVVILAPSTVAASLVRSAKLDDVSVDLKPISSDLFNRLILAT